jgi:hypothetical protein
MLGFVLHDQVPGRDNRRNAFDLVAEAALAASGSDRGWCAWIEGAGYGGSARNWRQAGRY